MSTFQTYVEENQDRFLDELFDLLRIPSVSTDSKFADDVRRTADFVKERLLEAKVDKAEVVETDGYPIVYAEKMVDPSKPTVLVYGHYDVQPADPYELWKSPPFEPEIRDGKIYARGACDDKGQMYMHVKALETMLANDALPCNVKFMIEGEEEVGSNHLAGFVKDNREKLQADVVLISDTGIIDNENPSITVGLRGLSYMEVEVAGPRVDLHSGMFGGTVANPINVLCQMIASLHDEQGRITIPGFYDKVVELSQEERAEINRAPQDDEKYKQELGVQKLTGEDGYTTLERIGIRPTLDVNGIWGGYISEGAKTVLPSKAYAKISMRLVPNQHPDEIDELFTKHFESIAPETVQVKVSPHHGGEPAVVPTDSPAIEAAKQAFQDAWGKEPFLTREGGSIPIVSLFQKELGIDSLLMGFGLDEDAIHSPNESYGVFNFLKGIETISLFYQHFAKA
ncbi:dipeptidase [Tunicatimonas pelagia]|uniref:dipeptidase n=1 Tax=Tunicatimonas pelagia TaxID=931531 RepID=UPI002665D08B|nr:dipeptidase [Tunicatimonas pelagia]WKN46042.1 dipeptidase [Tunicatimonas pelagia]